eukprot:gb/GFBE01072441.1/.p1 GENE.gb/GFBE01072441.1/~~gb/GFBE01072441.1/.p1  ORF type:complete len:184 (+),score=32.91 gb/GFBE01072441.1/:1-552(+)
MASALQTGTGRGETCDAQSDELCSLRWAFNFTPQAGGRGSATLQFVEFRPTEPGSSCGLLFMGGYPPLPYELSADGKVLDIANFPPHYVRRLDTWEWEITNPNVTLVSCVGDDVQYSDRGFLELTVENVLEESGDLVSREEAQEIIRNGGGMPQHILLFRLLHMIARARRAPDASEPEETEDE